MSKDVWVALYLGILGILVTVQIHSEVILINYIYILVIMHN